VETVLQSHKVLNFLDLSGLGFGDKGLKYVQWGLAKNRVLRDLNISGNDLSNDCKHILVEMLTHTIVKSLDISYNHLSMAGYIADRFLEIKGVIPSMAELNISNVFKSGFDDKEVLFVSYFKRLTSLTIDKNIFEKSFVFRDFITFLT